MAWQWSECAFRALKSSQCLYQLEPMAFRLRNASAKSPRFSSLAASQTPQRRLLSTSSSRASPDAASPINLENSNAASFVNLDESNAAPPINFDDKNAIPARIVPASPAYFSGTPRFIDHFLRLEHIRSKYASLPTVPHSEAPRMAWLKLSQFKVAVKELVSNSKYSQFIGILQRLSRINPSVMPEEVEQIMAEFLRPGNPYQQKPAPRKVDDIGRARGVGRRKTSTATVWLVEGDGQVMVNGKSIVQVFPRIHDRESALWALRVSERMDKYNVWAVVHGGGVTGQAEATALALARALLVHEPDLKPLLRRAGVITVDPRQVERKKPGLRGARKRPAWVKR